MPAHWQIICSRAHSLKWMIRFCFLDFRSNTARGLVLLSSSFQPATELCHIPHHSASEPVTPCDVIDDKLHVHRCTVNKVMIELCDCLQQTRSSKSGVQKPNQQVVKFKFKILSNRSLISNFISAGNLNNPSWWLCSKGAIARTTLGYEHSRCSMCIACAHGQTSCLLALVRFLESQVVMNCAIIYVAESQCQVPSVNCLKQPDKLNRDTKQFSRQQMGEVSSNMLFETQVSQALCLPHNIGPFVHHAMK